MKNLILELSNINFSYTQEEKTVIDVNLKIFETEKIIILGNNGAGKSTLFLTSNGVLKSESGKIFLNNKEIKYTKKLLMELRKQVGIVFQDPDKQFVAPTVEGEISFGLFNLGIDKSEIKVLIKETSELLGIENLLKRAPHTLSGGEKKLVSIADILVMKPKIIMFDEPTAGLDPQNIILFEKTLKKLSDLNMTMVIATHDVDFAWRWASRIVVMHKGTIIKDDSPIGVFEDESCLKKAGLIKPILFEINELLINKNILLNKNAIPKTIDEFRNLLNEK